jgi:isocitrate dehydrogenase
MTKDLAILIGPSSKYLTTNQFLDEIDGNLKQEIKLKTLSFSKA